ncbi:hypothetical protein HYH03_005234 [Edaphochlamys debaryana]|uniref:Protein kinase domain-containing protein n=1 Tax=Edaphochlamys debaryana TaxID=47281 RepID=A0A835Y821_9CHLO|nr:hypothetical protein HYH03_005234 [Edaphochlamys debaryana]|eukprot:KAG2496829.1 hypothetical protein HYH03_005234 [Edaphochlamys debaryana]
MKLAVTSGGLDKAGVREALVSPQLRHPHVVNTFAVRGAALTEEFLSELWGGRDSPSHPINSHGGGAASATRSTRSSLLPNFASEDGLGDPRPARNPREGWAEALARSGALPGKTLLLLVQEFCERGTLAHAIRQGRFRCGLPREHPDWAHDERVARRMVLRTAAEICRGMVHLHGANVIHGDLKPANVLLARSAADRRGFTVKIGDFGMTHLLDGDGSRCDSSTWGTLAYASPEAMNGEHTKKSDVFSFGVILSEMMTGKRPYENLMHGQIMMGVSLQGLRPELPDEEWPELCALARRCMEQDPDARPSFLELEDAMVELEEDLRRKGAESRRSSADQEQKSGVGRRRGSTASSQGQPGTPSGAGRRGGSPANTPPPTMERHPRNRSSLTTASSATSTVGGNTGPLAAGWGPPVDVTAQHAQHARLPAALQLPRQAAQQPAAAQHGAQHAGQQSAPLAAQHAPQRPAAAAADGITTPAAILATTPALGAGTAAAAPPPVPTAVSAPLPMGVTALPPRGSTDGFSVEGEDAAPTQLQSPSPWLTTAAMVTDVDVQPAEAPGAQPSPCPPAEPPPMTGSLEGGKGPAPHML